MVEKDERVGRWLVIRAAPSMQRRPSGDRMRRRVTVRCVCGTEATVFVEDLDGGLSRGCRSNLCRVRHQVAEELKGEGAQFKSVGEFSAWLDKFLREAPWRELQAQLRGDGGDE